MLPRFIRTLLEPTRDSEAPPAFLEPTAPPWALRGLATLLLALFAVAVLGAVAIPLPETVTSPFVLVPLRGADPLRTPLDGTVERST